MNEGNWDSIKTLKEKPLLLQVILDFINGLAPPILTSAELDLLCDLSASASIDRAHMGLLTGLADLVSAVIFP